MRKISLIALLMALCFILSACGSFVDLGDEDGKQIDRIGEHTDADGVTYMDIYYVGEDTPQSIKLPSGANGTSIGFSSKYDQDNRKTIVTVSFSNGASDIVFDIKDGQSVTSVKIIEGEIGIGDVLCFLDGNGDIVGEIAMSKIRGKDGTTWLTGTSSPSNSAGKEGDFFLNTERFDVYIKKNDAWEPVGNLTGVGIESISRYDSPDGSGVKITYTDGREPTTVVCPGITDIDLTLSEDKKQFVFVVKMNTGFVGEDGEETFTREFAVARFPQWDSGFDAPASEYGIVGDFYFQESSQTIWQKKETGWKIIISFGELINSEEDKVNVIFDANGGQMTISGYTNPTSKYTMQVVKGSFVHWQKIPIPTQDGYTFGGWYTVPTPNLLVNGKFTDMVPVTADITLYAYWIPNTPVE